MDIGVALALGGIVGSDRFEPPTWESIRNQVVAAEQVGFDLVIAEDALTQPLGDDVKVNHWESFAILGAAAAVTSRIRLGHGVINAPYRNPGLTAKIAETLDEVSGGRFFLGIGAGNTPDGDYRAFGIDADPRFSRFAETIEIIHALLKEGRATFDGEYHTAEDAELLGRSPHAGEIPIVIAAGGPRMMGLTARFADAWNWWGDMEATPETLMPKVDELERACEEAGRDPATLGRTLDLYLPVGGVPEDGALPDDHQTAERILSFGELGFTEVRCYLHPGMPGSRQVLPRVGLVESMGGVVELVHAG